MIKKIFTFVLLGTLLTACGTSKKQVKECCSQHEKVTTDTTKIILNVKRCCTTKEKDSEN